MEQAPLELVAQTLRQLVFDGRMILPRGIISHAESLRELEPVLRECDALARAHRPSGFPPLELEYANLGALTIFHSCVLLVYRDLGEEWVDLLLPTPQTAANPSAHASVDLLLRFLPDVVRLARSANRADPLVERLLALGRVWPLSSVGIAGIGEVDVTPLTQNSAVWQLYLDRVLAAADASRLADERVRRGVQAAAGAFPELAGKLATQLQRVTPEPTLTEPNGSS